MYRIIILPNAYEGLAGLDKAIAQRVTNRLDWLAENIGSIRPLPLKGSLSGFCKLRVGDWRIIYEVVHDERAIYIHKVGHRREIYK